MHVMSCIRMYSLTKEQKKKRRILIIGRLPSDTVYFFFGGGGGRGSLLFLSFLSTKGTRQDGRVADCQKAPRVRLSGVSLPIGSGYIKFRGIEISVRILDVRNSIPRHGGFVFCPGVGLGGQSSASAPVSGSFVCPLSFVLVGRLLVLFLGVKDCYASILCGIPSLKKNPHASDQ